MLKLVKVPVPAVQPLEANGTIVNISVCELKTPPATQQPPRGYHITDKSVPTPAPGARDVKVGNVLVAVYVL